MRRLAIALLLVGCSETATTTTTEDTPTTRQATTITKAPTERMTTTTATPTAEVSAPQPLTMGTLLAGEYQTGKFEPTLTFTLPDEWHQYFPEEADQIAIGGPNADMNMTRPSRVLDPETGTVDAPEDLADWLLNHPRFEATEAASAQVAGIESRVIDIEGPTGTVEFFAYPEGNMRVPAGVAARFVVVPMDGPDLVLVVYPMGGTLADAIDATQSIVDSLAIVDGP